MRKFTALIVLGLAACADPATPEDALRSWYAGLAQGDVVSVWDGLSAASQARLNAAALAWERGGEDLLAPDGPTPSAANGQSVLQHWMRASGGLPDLPAATDDLVGAAVIEGDRAVVSVRGPTGPLKITLVREDGSWRVLLRLP